MGTLAQPGVSTVQEGAAQLSASTSGCGTTGCVYVDDTAARHRWQIMGTPAQPGASAVQEGGAKGAPVSLKNFFRL